MEINMFKKMANSIQNFFQRLYGVALFLYFGGLTAATAILSVLFPVIAVPVIIAAVAIVAISAFVLAAVRNTVNGFFNFFQKSSTPVATTTAETSTTHAPRNTHAHGSTRKMHAAFEQDKPVTVASKTVFINKNTLEANDVRKSYVPRTVRRFMDTVSMELNIAEQETTTPSPTRAA